MVKISALPVAILPLDGTEELAIVQAGQTRRVPNSDLAGGGGSGEGGINYIDNGRFELDASGWVAEANLGFVRNTSAPLRGDGDGQISKPASDESTKSVYTDFTVDPADVLSVMAIRFAFTTDANYLSGDFRVQIVEDPGGTPVVIYDQPLPPGQGGEFADYFSTTAATSYRFQLYCETADATTRQINIDTVQVGPNQISVGPNVGDWIDAGPLIIVGETTDPTKGTTTFDKMWYRRVGDSAEIHMAYHQSGAGTNGSGVYNFVLPDGLRIDTSKVNPNGNAGRQSFGVAAVSDERTGNVYFGQTDDRVRVVASDAGQQGVVSGTQFSLGPANRAYGLHFTVPILGWGGSPQPVSPMSQPYLWGERFGGSATLVTAAPAKLGEYRAWRKTGNTTVGTGVDTTPNALPSAADGLRAYSLNYAATGVVGEPNAYDIFVGVGMAVTLRTYLSAGRTGTVYTDPRYWRSDAGTQANLGVNWHYDPVTGIVRIDASNSANDQNDVMRFGTNTAGAEVSDGWLDLLVTPRTNPLSLTSEALVHVAAGDTSGQAVTANVTDFQYLDNISDSHGAWDGSAFTAPRAGTYIVAFVSAVGGGAHNFGVWVNGALLTYVSAEDANNYAHGGSIQVAVGQGDQISIRCDQTKTRSSDAERNHLSITEVR